MDVTGIFMSVVVKATIRRHLFKIRYVVVPCILRCCEGVDTAVVWTQVICLLRVGFVE